MTGIAVRDQRAGCGDEGQRRDAGLAAGLAAAGLAVTGLAELLAVITRSVALLGDAIHDLSDVPPSRWCFRASRSGRGPHSAVIRTDTSARRAWLGSVSRLWPGSARYAPGPGATAS
jgi:hypothetical protein